MSTFRKILIANRGEIALRIMRTARTMGIICMVIYAKSDKNALFVKEADESYSLGNGSLADTYLNISKVIDIAIQNGADAIHPGYGFLSENPKFAEACEKRGITFIGPSAKAIQLMSNKLDALAFAKSIDIPVLNPIHISNSVEIEKLAGSLTYPVIIKAAAGGGGKGMRIVYKAQEFKQSVEAAQRESGSSFGNNQVFVEPYITSPRHIEVQILADNFGNVVHLFDRECSIQRRHQKIIEEAPSPTLTKETRTDILATAVKIAREMNYTNAGTIEFLLDEIGKFYFLEMNTRIQVEHPVTEMITGIDIVKEQLNIAMGEKLAFQQHEITRQGHAIEARIYAEDAFNDFVPSVGYIQYYKVPVNNEIRIESSINCPSEISSDFDPMIAKIITHGRDREDARKKLFTGLSQCKVHGITTNVDYLKQVLSHPLYIENKVSTHFCLDEAKALIENYQNEIRRIDPSEVIGAFLAYEFSGAEDVNLPSAWQSIGYWRANMHAELEISGKKYDVSFKKTGKNQFKFNIEPEAFSEMTVLRQGNEIAYNLNGKHINATVSDHNNTHYIAIQNITLPITRTDRIEVSEAGNITTDISKNNQIVSPLHGKVVKVNIKPSEKVNKGDILIVIESMKMENNIIAHREGQIDKVLVSPGDRVAGRELLAILA